MVKQKVFLKFLLGPGQIFEIMSEWPEVDKAAGYCLSSRVSTFFFLHLARFSKYKTEKKYFLNFNFLFSFFNYIWFTKIWTPYWPFAWTLKTNLYAHTYNEAVKKSFYVIPGSRVIVHINTACPVECPQFVIFFIFHAFSNT